MNIRPVDLQVMIPRSVEVGKTQQTMEQQLTLQQQQLGQEGQRVAAEKQKKVQNRSNVAEGKVQREKEFKEHQDSSEGKKQDHSDCMTSPSSDKDSDPFRGHRIDIKT